jgi:RimJ/RimL family protein N-acetyltransferase
MPNPSVKLSTTLALEAQRTQRLLLAPYQPEDVAPLFAFMRDASSMKHTYIAPSLEHCRVEDRKFKQHFSRPLPARHGT